MTLSKSVACLCKLFTKFLHNPSFASNITYRELFFVLSFMKINTARITAASIPAMAMATMAMATMGHS